MCFNDAILPRRIRRIRCIFAVLSFLPGCLAAQPPSGGRLPVDPLTERTRSGNFEFIMDYRRKIIEAEGWGASGAESATLAGKRVHALEEARRVAYLRLAESIGNIRMEGRARLSGSSLIHSAFVSSVHAFLRGVRVTDEAVSFRSDGSAIARVRLRLPFYGENGLAGALWMERGSSADDPGNSGEEAAEDGYTGIILKLVRGTVTLGFAPRLLLPDGSALYSWEHADSGWLRKWGAVEYVTDIASVRERTGGSPLVLHVVSIPGSPDFILDERYVRAAHACSGKIWSECRIAVLIE